MQKPKIPHNEKDRLADLKRLQILDSEKEKDFDDLVDLASAICDVPISLITLIDENRQWFKAKKGLKVESTDRDISFCGHAINYDDIFIVENAVADKRFYDNPLVTDDPNIRFYAGMPIKSEKGFNLGTLCVIDSKPKKLNETQIAALKTLSTQATKLIELRDKKHELEKKNHDLENLNNLNNQITSIISHDIKGPISSLRSYMNSDYVNINDLNALQELFPVVKENLNNLGVLVENLLEWSSNINDVHITSFNLFDLIIEISSLFESDMNQKNIKMEFDIDFDLIISGDASMIKFIMRNLINNAVKFTEDGTIRIEAQKTQEHRIEIKVKDTGVGMSPEIIERIFIKKKKVSTKGTRNERGTGLGLKLIREFLTIHNSELNIDSKENEGSIFSFTLPLSFEK
ncbi:GAF domain-containing sensor histidine kinase [Marivirga arenosa]|uniref:histidine kinase n=1 Tax=Marivirga arenosa TaxID=3059076 RepID=A0AA49GD20_9BACT|nr:GAF domain-containing sensor histidine kinase [Marivirga sp. BKB1-2]WKK79185.2 GAF domain-containing sensor histidine kinase [Marivirga sp. BKB1-2]